MKLLYYYNIVDTHIKNYNVDSQLYTACQEGTNTSGMDYWTDGFYICFGWLNWFFMELTVHD